MHQVEMFSLFVSGLRSILQYWQLIHLVWMKDKLLECCLISASPFSSWTVITQCFHILCVKEFFLLIRGGTVSWWFNLMVFNCAVNTLVYRLMTYKATVAPRCGKSSSGWYLGSLWTLTGWGNLFPSWNLVSEEYTDTIWEVFCF